VEQQADPVEADSANMDHATASTVTRG